MKPSSKAVMIGCISFFVFLYGNLLFSCFFSFPIFSFSYFLILNSQSLIFNL